MLTVINDKLLSKQLITYWEKEIDLSYSVTDGILVCQGVEKKMKIPSELIRPFPLYKDGASFKNVISALQIAFKVYKCRVKSTSVHCNVAWPYHLL